MSVLEREKETFCECVCVREKERKCCVREREKGCLRERESVLEKERESVRERCSAEFPVSDYMETHFRKKKKVERK